MVDVAVKMKEGVVDHLVASLRTVTRRHLRLYLDVEHVDLVDLEMIESDRRHPKIVAANEVADLYHHPRPRHIAAAVVKIVGNDTNVIVARMRRRDPNIRRRSQRKAVGKAVTAKRIAKRRNERKIVNSCGAPSPERR